MNNQRNQFDHLLQKIIKNRKLIIEVVLLVIVIFLISIINIQFNQSVNKLTEPKTGQIFSNKVRVNRTNFPGSVDLFYIGERVSRDELKVFFYFTGNDRSIDVDEIITIRIVGKFTNGTNNAVYYYLNTTVDVTVKGLIVFIPISTRADHFFTFTIYSINEPIKLYEFINDLDYGYEKSTISFRYFWYKAFFFLAFAMGILGFYRMYQREQNLNKPIYSSLGPSPYYPNQGYQQPPPQGYQQPPPQGYQQPPPQGYQQPPPQGYQQPPPQGYYFPTKPIGYGPDKGQDKRGQVILLITFIYALMLMIELLNQSAEMSRIFFIYLTLPFVYLYVTFILGQELFERRLPIAIIFLQSIIHFLFLIARDDLIQSQSERIKYTGMFENARLFELMSWSIILIPIFVLISLGIQYLIEKMSIRDLYDKNQNIIHIQLLFSIIIAIYW